MARRRRQTRRPKQGDLFLNRGWGGKRSNAGRKKSPRSGVSHLERVRLSKSTPVHVTMRVERGLRLRRKAPFAVIRACIHAAQERFGFRVVHFSVQNDHLHLIVEASDKRSLARGMQGLTIRLARRLNRALDRKGKLFTDRYHAEYLTTPTQVRNAIAYVLNNHRKHAWQKRTRIEDKTVDLFSSAPHFDGWRGSIKTNRDAPTNVTVGPRTWLLNKGWRKRGRLDPSAIPGQPARRRGGRSA